MKPKYWINRALCIDFSIVDEWHWLPWPIRYGLPHAYFFDVRWLMFTFSFYLAHKESRHIALKEEMPL